MKEIWKDIKGYEGIYQVSNLGRVKSLKCGKERILKLGRCRKYLKVNLHKNGLQKSYKIHQLVAQAFLGHTPDGYKVVVDHIDNDKTNNRVDNLQLTTNRHNSSKDRKNKTSKYTGVCWNKNKNKWVAHIHVAGKLKYLGSFICEYSAHLAYQKELKGL